MIYSDKKIIKKISNKIKIDSFLREVLTPIEYYLNQENTKCKTSKNKMYLKTYTCDISVEIGTNKVLYVEEHKNRKVIREYIETENGYITKTIREDKEVTDLLDEDSIDITTKTEVNRYDKNKIEIFRRNTEKKENYYEHKLTKMRALHSPDIFENYTKNEYLFRMDNGYVVKRDTMKYVYPNETAAFIDLKNTDDCYLWYGKLTDENKELPNGGYFYGIYNEVFFSYKQGEATTNDIVENFKSKKI